MNLLKQTFLAAKWIFGILRVFMRLQPLTTLTITIFSVLSRITSVLAFFLPLKVILLAGSSGVPHYFRFFIEPAEKSDWLVMLSIAAVASYVLTLLLDAVSARLAKSGSAGILEGTNKLSLVGKQGRQASSNYSRLMEVIASAAFTLAGLIVLTLVNPVLSAALGGLFLTEFLFTALVLVGWNAAYPGKFQVFIRGNLGDYLSVLSSINFLASFFVILAPFLFGQHGNILLAILAVLIIRRTLSALASMINNVVDLYTDRNLIDPLIFRKRQLWAKESVESQVVREVFSKTSRQTIAGKHLDPVRPLKDIEVHWQDSPIKNAYTFVIAGTSGKSGRRECFQQQVFSAKHTHLLEKEDFLFSIISRDKLKASPVISRFREGKFECQICAYSPEAALQPERYRAVLAELLADIWCFNPPRKLVTAFSAARAALPGRLTADFIDRLAIACDFPAESAALETLRSRLPEVRAWLERLPKHVFNPDIKRANVVETAPGDIRIMTWTRWMIEPVGVGMPEALPRNMLPDLVKRFNSGRKDLESELTLQDIEFADMCWNLERAVKRSQYKQALKSVAKIIDCLADKSGIDKGE